MLYKSCCLFYRPVKMLVFPIPFASYTSLYIIISTFGNLCIKYIDMLITNHYQSYILDKERKDKKGQKKKKISNNLDANNFNLRK